MAPSEGVFFANGPTRGVFLAGGVGLLVVTGSGCMRVVAARKAANHEAVEPLPKRMCDPYLSPIAGRTAINRRRAKKSPSVGRVGAAAPKNRPQFIGSGPPRKKIAPTWSKRGRGAKKPPPLGRNGTKWGRFLCKRTNSRPFLGRWTATEPTRGVLLAGGPETDQPDPCYWRPAGATRPNGRRRRHLPPNPRG